MDVLEKLNLKLDVYDNKLTRSNKQCVLNRFFEIAGVKDEYDEYDALKFINWAKEHYRGTAILQVSQILKWFYKNVLKQDLDLKTPEVNYDEVENVALSKEDVVKIIQNRKIYGPILKGYVALATIYGARRKEMHDMKPEDIDIENRRVFIRTAKSGRDTWRWMYLPEEIVPVMEQFKDQWHVFSISDISKLFRIVCHASGIKLSTRRAGWHMIRRRLILELTKAGLSDNVIVRFMRWKRKDVLSNILYRYRQSEPDEELIEEVDKKVMEVHPFLSFWRDDA